MWSGQRTLGRDPDLLTIGSCLHNEQREQVHQVRMLLRNQQMQKENLSRVNQWNFTFIFISIASGLKTTEFFGGVGVNCMLLGS
jgi:hypothetical protein